VEDKGRRELIMGQKGKPSKKSNPHLMIFSAEDSRKIFALGDDRRFMSSGRGGLRCWPFDLLSSVVLGRKSFSTVASS